MSTQDLSYPELVGHNFNSFLLILRVTNARYLLSLMNSYISLPTYDSTS